GSRAPAVARLTRAAPELAEPLSPGSGAIGAELVFAAREEWAQSLGDLLLRRCMVGLGADLGAAALPAALAVARRHLGWSAARAQAEATAYRAEIALFRPPADAGDSSGRDGSSN
ncbi:MAG: glycerol-3-phosphate dehydrogenase/oxidase, partial [Gammaproteobacteria bacterium]|nr:glycerol-3-phosphate dehydrogenase/oxidase [Gammaproteobacteria bacterium]